ncbi:helix-turn-helix domain-containing protein [Chitinophaga sp. 22321]|uniref:Helix-turn-helix transcriptional regulator n=1 Tax=Chitinophaga hostae TaxID=2831022 RepID=A0ABS5JD51_9BACT|nr:helix-turn-helix transcriptional regulator [Chitinophaga hostae]MBS0032412.1 helix-turn-helix transcriptional regulator [Chitinophaga hostae]
MDDIEEQKILKEFGKRLQKLRKAKKLSIRNFAYAAELSVSYVQKLEAGMSNPSYTTLIKIVNTLGLELNEFNMRS